MRDTKSGLTMATLFTYRWSDNLERFNGKPIYMHHGSCPSFCDYACNGKHGEDIASDIEDIEASIVARRSSDRSKTV